MSKNNIISLICLFAILALSLYFWVLQKSIILADGSYNITVIWQSVALFTVLLVFTSLCLVISNWPFGILLATILPLTFLFKFGFTDKIYLMVAGAGFVFGFFAYMSAARDRSLKIKLGISSASSGVKLYFMIALLLLTALFYNNNFVKGEVKISEAQIKYILPAIESQIKSQVPFYTTDITVDHLIVISALSSGEVKIKTENLSADLQKKIKQKIAEQSLKDMQATMQYPEIQKLIIDDFIASNSKTMAKLRDEYGKQFGIQINQGQSLVSALVDGVNSYIAKLLAPFKDYLPIVLAVAFFLGFKALSSIFVGVSVSIAGILFHLLKAGGVLNINKVPVMKETLQN